MPLSPHPPRLSQGMLPIPFPLALGDLRPVTPKLQGHLRCPISPCDVPRAASFSLLPSSLRRLLGSAGCSDTVPGAGGWQRPRLRHGCGVQPMGRAAWLLQRWVPASLLPAQGTPAVPRSTPRLALPQSVHWVGGLGVGGSKGSVAAPVQWGGLEAHSLVLTWSAGHRGEGGGAGAGFSPRPL